jgi:hypothetical protein
MTAEQYAVNDGLKYIEHERGNPTFIWNIVPNAPSSVGTGDGRTYPCIASTPQQFKMEGVGGFAIEADLILQVRTEVLTNGIPSPQHIVTYNGKQYRIEHVRPLNVGASYRFLCEHITKGI